MRNSFALGAGLACRLPTPHIPRRSFVTTVARGLAAAASSAPAPAPPLNPRWLSELQARIKRCAGLDLSEQQKGELKALREAIDGQWLELLAGREGFLTGPGWRGLDRHTVTWGDQVRCNAVGHVNNVVYNKYAESARVNWLRNFATTVDPEHKDEWNQLMSPRDLGLIMRSIKTDYKFPMAYPDHVTVLHKLVSKPTYGSDFILLEALLISDGHRRPAARCFEDIVVYDYKTAKRAPLKPFMVDRLRETYEAQEKSKVECEDKVKGFVEIVERLEKAARWKRRCPREAPDRRAMTARGFSSAESGDLRDIDDSMPAGAIDTTPDFQDLSITMSSISFREHIRWIPDEASEPTSTVVLTSPQRRFVDLRILKQPPTVDGVQDTHGIERLEWGIAGTSSSSLRPDGQGGEVRHSRWEHWIDSRTTAPENAADEGDMYEQPDGLTLEKGRMVNPATGRETDYEELWRDIDPVAVLRAGADAEEKGVECVVLKFEDESTGARGMVVWLGRFCQGISRVGEEVAAERWEWKEGEGWRRTVRIGDRALPCEVLLVTGAALSVGTHVVHEKVVWDVLESS
ncbi:hypothetical protein CORC01_09637 [Colletotrichum orchidophilum]|uniref:Protein HRI1 n=1 Tax=Colletotrichum orchidophilum TaxID=1209926 RepID=A0A1G4B198_9PEZI|nr:uncharacterized protein CORC01_09637 [Colletotrichum orchidophilum]OHE95113.1 hypothetical protein CORC01_09637 [Colletotrichum orchidophilum]